jgi:hypothetical protein
VNLDSYFLLEKRVQKAENKIAEIIELNKKLVKKRRKVKI